MSKPTVLVVDNDADIRELVAYHLDRANMDVVRASSGREALRKLEDCRFDAMVLDIMMDDLSGLEVLTQIRRQGIESAVILLSAREKEMDKVQGLQLGADDYVTKPFSTLELVARVQANIRRLAKTQQTNHAETLEYGSLRFDPSAYVLYKHGQAVPLTGTEATLLQAFMRAPNQAFTKAEIFNLVWEHQAFDENALNVYISRLRQKIEDDPKKPKYIQTIWGIGYRFKGD